MAVETGLSRMIAVMAMVCASEAFFHLDMANRMVATPSLHAAVAAWHGQRGAAWYNRGAHCGMSGRHHDFVC
jgi:hypothetical protein